MIRKIIKKWLFDEEEPKKSDTEESCGGDRSFEQWKKCLPNLR